MLASGLAFEAMKLYYSLLQHCASACTAQDRLCSALQMARPGGACPPLQGPVSPLVLLCCAVPYMKWLTPTCSMRTRPETALTPVLWPLQSARSQQLCNYPSGRP